MTLICTAFPVKESRPAIGQRAPCGTVDSVVHVTRVYGAKRLARCSDTGVLITFKGLHPPLHLHDMPQACKGLAGAARIQ